MTKHFYNIVHKNTVFVFLFFAFCIDAIGQSKSADNTAISSFVPPPDMAYASNTKSFGYKRMNELSNALEKQNLSSFVNEFGVKPVSNALATTVETLPAGTLIIAMDFALQESSDTRVRQAYGLAVRLLHAGVPLKWIIDPNKSSRTAVDLSASARLRYPTTGSYATRNFKTGPIAIYPGFETQAAAIINSYGNAIRVYELQNATSANVHSNLTHKPYVFVEQSENPTIHTSILSAAGLSSGTHYTTGLMTTVTQNQCVTIITVPHNSTISTEERNAIKAFTRNGGNFFAQCAAVRGFQATDPRVFTNAGFSDDPGLGTYLYDNPEEPSAQFEGAIPSAETGSLTSFGFSTNPPGGTRIVHDNEDDFRAYTGRIDGVTTSDGGYVHYLGGHDYSGDINTDRYYLNAVLRSAIRPTSCNLNLGPISQNDNGSIDCGMASVTINVLANDTNPLGGPLTVNLIGSGTNGTFVNNNNGTVTYTGNVNGFWGGDQINYQACSGAVCSQATITITSNNPSQTTINGTVFVDANNNGTLNSGETGGTGITVRLYRDLNNNGVKDSGEPLVTSTNTTAGGSYTFLDNSITPATTTTISNRVVNDDSWQNATGTNFPSMFEEAGDVIRYKAYRWTGLNIPANATITNATVTVTGYRNGGIPVTIRAENLNAAPAYTSASNYLSGRAVTSNSVTWNVPALSDNVTYTSPNFASVVQQAVSNNSGLANLSLIFNNTTGSWITWNLDDGASAKYQKLNLTYTVPGNPANFVVEVDQTTLPAGSTFTTDNVETANFTALGQLDCNNNFGYVSCPTPTISITPTNSTVCTGATLTLSRTVSGGSGTCTTQWQSSTSASGPFTNISGATSATYTVPTSSSGTVYYRATYTCTGSGCGVGTSNVATVVINERPTITGSTPTSRCGTGTVNLGATASAGTINWYAAAAGGASLGNGTSFTTPSIATTTTYYVDATLNGCTTASRTAVVATINDIPTITGNTPASRCGTGTVNLGATASAGMINWYAAAAGGASLGNGTSFTTTSIVISTTYYVDATLNGCTTASRTAVVATINDIPTITGSTPANRCGTGTVNLGAVASAGTINWYAAAAGGASLGNGTSFTTPSIAISTTYYVDATLNGCTTASRTAIVATINALPTTPVSTVDCSAGFGNATIQVTSPIGANFEYSLNGGAYQSNPLFTGVANGNATIIARNITTSCTSAPATVNVNCGCVNSPTLSLGSISGSTCGISPFTVSGNIFGGSATSVIITENGFGTITSGSTSNTSPFSFTYTPAAGDIGNVVTITVTTNNPLGAPCASAISTYTLTVNAIPMITATTPGSRCGTGTVNLGATTNGGTINWYAAETGGTSLGNGTSFTTPSISSTTTYYVDATQNGCTTASRTSVVATVNAIPTITGSTSGSRCGTGTVNLGATASAGTINWYAAANGGSSLGTGISFTTPNISTTTTYYVDATLNGCTTASRTAVVATVNQIPNEPQVGAITQPSCSISTGSVQLSGLPSGNWTITRNPGNVTTTGNTSSTTISGLPAGNTYTFTVTNSNNCISIVSENVIINAVPNAPIVGGATQVCVGATANVTPNTNGAWGSNNSTIAIVNSSGLVTGVSAGTVTLTYTRFSDGCSTDVLFTVNASPSAPIVGAITQPTCNIPTGSVQLSGLPSGNWTITRFPDNVSITGNTSSITISGLPTGVTYSFLVANANNCLSELSGSVMINNAPTPPIIGGATEVCVGSTTNITPNSGGIWGSSNTTVALVNIAGEVTGVSAGTVTLTFTRFSDGCSNNVTFTVKGNPTAPVVGAITQPTCAVPTGSVALSGLATGRWTIIRLPDGVFATGDLTSTTLVNLPPGATYTFLVTNSNNCTSPASGSVVINAAPTAPAAPTLTVVQPSSCIAPNNTGSITVTAPTPLTDYTFSFDNGATYQASATKSGLVAGTYQVVVKNIATNCVSLPTSQLINAAPTAPAAPTLTAVQPSSCIAPNNIGSITVTTPTPLTDYTFSFDNGATYQASATKSGLVAGTYQVVVKNIATNCVSPATSQVINAAPTTPAAPTLTAVQPSSCVAPNNTGTITVTAPTPLTDYTFSFDNGATYQASATKSGLVAGTYQVVVKNIATNCVSPATSQVINATPTAPAAPTLTAVQPSSCIAPNNTGSLTVTAPTPLTDYTFSFDNGATYQTSATKSGLVAGTYQVVVKNIATNCVSPATSQVINAAPTAPAAPTLTAVQPSSCIAPNNTGSLTVTAPTPLTDYTFSFDNGATYQTSATKSGLAAGTYQVVVKNIATNCVSLPTSQLINATPTAPAAPTLTAVQPSSCTAPNNTGSITVTAPTPLTDYTFSFDNGATYQASATKSGLTAGTYQVVVKNIATNCVSLPTSQVINAAPTAPAAPTLTAVQPSSCIAPNNIGSITVTTPTPLTDYTFSFDNGATYQASATKSGLVAGTYQVVVKNIATNCVSLPMSQVINAAPTAPAAPTLTAVQPSSCVAPNNTGSITVTAPTPLTDYTFSFDNGATYQASATKSGLVAGTYQVVVKNIATNCVSLPTSQVINATPTSATIAAASTQNPSTCGNNDGFIVINGLATGTSYTLMYTQNGGSQTTVTIPATGSTSYTLSGLTAGSYVISVMSNGCLSNTINASLNDPTTATITLGSKVNPTACGNNDGRITISGVAPGTAYVLNYSKDGIPQTPISFTSVGVSYVLQGLIAGNYTNIRVINAGCVSNSISALLTDPGAAVLANLSSTNPSACGAANGSVTFSGLSTGITYSIQYSKNGIPQSPISYTATGTSYTITGLGAGAYTNIRVIDATCVSNRLSITLFDPGAAVISATSINPSICGASDGSITIGGLTSGLSYILSFVKDGVQQATSTFVASGTSYIISGLNAGYYTGITVNQGGCISNPLAELLSNPTAATIDYVAINPTACGGVNGKIIITGLAQGVTYTLNYSKNGTPQTPITINNSTSTSYAINGLTIGSYTGINVTQGVCTSNNLNLTLVNPPAPAAPINAIADPNPLCAGTFTDLSATCATGTLNWYSDATLTTLLTSTSVNPSATKIYYATCTANGCESVATEVTVTVINCTSSIKIVKSQTAISGQTVGSTITYSLVVTNTGNTTLTNVTVTDANATLSGTNPIATLAPSGTASLTAVHTLTQADLNAGKVINIANVTGTTPTSGTVTDVSDTGTDTNGTTIPNPETVDGPDPDTDPTNDPTETLLTPLSSIKIVKSQTAISGQMVGSTISYSLVVTNTGNTTLTNVTVTDANATLSGTNPIATLAPSGTASLTAVHTLTQADLNAGKVINIANVTGTTPTSGTVTDVSDTGTDTGGNPITNPEIVDGPDTDTDPTNDPTETILTPLSSIKIVKSQTAISGQTVGSTITYSLLVTNTGNTTLTNVTVSDANATLSGINPIATLAPSGTTTLTAVHTLTQADLNAGKVINIANVTGTTPTLGIVTDVSDTGTDTNGTTIPNPETVDGPDPDTDPTNDPTETTLTPLSSIKIVKSQTAISGQTVGSTISYSLVVTNTGNTTLTNVTVTDANATLSGTNPIATLAPSGTASLTAVHALTQADLNAGKVINIANVTGTTPTSGTVTDISDTGTDTNGTTIPNPETVDGPDPDTDPTNDPTETLLTPLSSIKIVKSQTAISGQTVGSTITYSLVVTNAGNTTLTNVTVTDANATLSGTNPIATLAPSGTASLTAVHTLTQADLNAGKVINIANVTGTTPTSGTVTDVSDTGTDTNGTVIPNPELVDGPDPDTDPTNDPTETLLTPLSSIKIVKSQTAISGQTVGSTISYSLVVTNTGNTALTNVTVTDANATLSGINPIATLAPSATASLTAVHALTQADLNAGKVINIANVTGTTPTSGTVTDVSDTGTDTNGTVIPNPELVDGPDPDTDPTNDPTETTLTPLSSIRIVKSQLAISGQTVGSTISYSLVVTNTGNTTLTNVTVTDANATLSGTNPIATLAPSATASLTAVHTLTQADLNAGKVINIANVTGTTPSSGTVTDVSDTGTDTNGTTIPNPETVDGPDPDTDPTNDPTETILTPLSSIKIVKSQTAISGQTVGSTITYSLLVTNTGNTTLTNVTVSDANATLSGINPIATLAPSGTTTLTAVHTLTQADLNAGKVINIANVTGTTPTSGTVTDVSDTGTDTGGNPINTPETVDGPDPDTDPTNDPTETLLTPLSSIKIVKSQTAISGQTVGSTITYSLVVTNTGNTTLTNVTVTDANATLSGTNPIATLAPSATASLTAVHTLTQADLNAGKVINIANVTGTTPTSGTVTDVSDTGTDTGGNPINTPEVVDGPDLDTDPTNDPTETLLTPLSSIRIVKSQTAISGQIVGSTITYSLVVTNTGNTTLTNVTVTDANATLSGTNPIATLAPSATASLTAVHTLTQADLNVGKVINIANVTGTTPTSGTVTDVSDTGTDTNGTPIPTPELVDGPDPDPDPTNDPTETILTPLSSIRIVKSQTAISGQSIGSTITYSLVVTNTGNTTLTNVTVTDANATITSGINPILSFAPSATVTMTAVHTLTQADLIAGKVINIANVTGTTPSLGTVTDVSDTGTDTGGNPINTPELVDGPDPDTDPTNDPTETTLATLSSIRIVKSQTAISGQTVGSTITYSLEVTNTGNTTLTNVTVTDANATITSGINPILIFAPSATVTMTAVHTLTQADLNAGKVINIANVTGTTPSLGTVSDVSDTGTDTGGNPINTPETVDGPDTDTDPTNDPTETILCPAPMALINGGITPVITCPGGSATLSATGCSSGVITWTSSPVSIVPANGIVNPTVTTTYTATCTKGTCVSPVSNAVTLILGPCANPDGIIPTIPGILTIIPILANDKNSDGTPADLAKVTVPIVSTNPSKGTTLVNPDGTISYTPNIGASGSDSFIYTICDKSNPIACDTAKVTVSITAILDVKLQLKVFLQGAFFSPSSPTDVLMRDNLRSLGVIPAIEPYTAMVNSRFTKVSDAGGQTIGTGVLTTTGSDAVVDWVFVELRDAANPATVLKTRAALVQRDGDVVEAADGLTPVTFTGAVGTNYYVSVKHRNHLGAMTASPILMTATGTVVDFTTMTAAQLWDSGLVLSDGSLGSFNGSEEVLLPNGKMALWAGNTRNADNKVKYTGTTPDPASILSQVITYNLNTGGLYNYDFVTPVYMTGDVNLDGKVKYAGTFTDTAFILFNVINKFPNNFINKLYNFDFMVEQIP